jgi:hypothetical protein
VNRDLLHDGPYLRTDYPLQDTITGRLQIGKNHGYANELSLRRAHRKEDGYSTVLQAVLIERHRAIVRQRLHRFEHQAVLIGSECPLTEPENIGLFVVKGDRVQAQWR